MPRGKRTAMSVVSPQVEEISKRLTPVEMAQAVQTMLLSTRKKTKDEALVIASLLQTQLMVMGLRGLAADVANIQSRLRDFDIE